MTKAHFERIDHALPEDDAALEQREPVSMMPQLSQEAFAQQIARAAEDPGAEVVREQIDAAALEQDNTFKGYYWQVPPHWVVQYYYSPAGRVRGNIPGTNRVSWGSGSLISPRMVVTAAHVISNGTSGQVYDPLWFTPRFPEETRRYFVKRSYIMPGWLGSGADYRWDVAVLYMHEDVPCDAYHGVKVNVPVHGHNPPRGFGWSTVAYPAEPPFGKQDFMISDGGPASPRGFWDGNLYFQAGFQAWEDYDLKPGASGGPWLWYNPQGEVIWPGQRDHPRLGPHMINGVNSYTVDGKPGIIYSPHFRGEHKAFFQSVFADVAANP